MYISTQGHSLRSQPAPDGDGELLLVGGASHKTGQGDEAGSYRSLEEYARERFDVTSVEYRWSTQDNIPLDSVPYVGKLAPFSKRVLVATGFRKWGFANGTAAAIILADAVKGAEHPWAATFDSNRLGPPSAALSFVKENVERRPAVLPGPPQARLGRRRRARRGRHRARRAAPGRRPPRRARRAARASPPAAPTWAASSSGTTAERSWDCPCHGSRFGTDGRVLQGPAVAPLEPRELDDS